MRRPEQSALESASSSADPTALSRSLAHFARPRGPDLLERTERLAAWIEARTRAGVWPYVRSLEAAPRTTTSVRDAEGRVASGTNFASLDYLGLASHPHVQQAAIAALREFGPHSASSGALQGETRLSLDLQGAVREFLEMDHVVLFPTGWAAGFGSVVGLVRPYDYVVMDNLAHACLQQGASAATPNVLRHEHLDVEAARALLREIRAGDAKAGILLITEGLFSMDADSPQIAALQEACGEYQATLLIDVAHDLGSVGPGGTGQLGIQGTLGQADLVMGSFSKTFASNGGFLATRSEAVAQFVKSFGGSWTFSVALSPVQAGTALAALHIARSQEGEELRDALMATAIALREEFARLGIRCLGAPGPIVPVPVGAEAVARVASGLLFERGVLANLVEFPAVPVGGARIRMQLIAGHTEQQASEAAAIIAGAIDEARASLDPGPR